MTRNLKRATRSKPTRVGTVEVFGVSTLEAIYNRNNADHATADTIFEPGWYWTDERARPVGPFDTEESAWDDAPLPRLPGDDDEA